MTASWYQRRYDREDADAAARLAMQLRAARGARTAAASYWEVTGSRRWRLVAMALGQAARPWTSSPVSGRSE